MTSGGHLLTYEALHLTEISRSFDDSKDSEGVKRGEYATNESHAVDRQIIRMMLAMPDLVGTRRKCRLQLRVPNLFRESLITPSFL